MRSGYVYLLGMAEQHRAKADIREKGRQTLEWMEKKQQVGIVLAGRPYHIDPEITTVSRK